MLSHAYIFHGPDENSKNKIAYWFANMILSARGGKFHPDLFSIRPEIDEDISINLVRQLKKFLALRPYSSEYKVVLIEAAEQLNHYAQNALLKIFEEAPSHAIIILCAKTSSSILDTIASRAVKLPFWHVQPDALPQDKIISDVFEDFLKTEQLNKYANIEKLNSFKALEILTTWLNFLRMKFKSNPTKEFCNLLVKSQNIYFKLNETNINPRFAYDELILSLWKT